MDCEEVSESECSFSRSGSRESSNTNWNKKIQHIPFCTTINTERIGRYLPLEILQQLGQVAQDLQNVSARDIVFLERLLPSTNTRQLVGEESSLMWYGLR
jgi:hypothetical protein